MVHFVCNLCSKFSYLQAAEYRENKIHTGWLDSRIAMRVRAERPPWYLSVVGGALYVWFLFLENYDLLGGYEFSYKIHFPSSNTVFLIFQEASSRSSSVVTDYVGYLSKGQIPPKVQTI